MIKFKNLDASARTVTFDIDGQEIVRGVPEFFEGTIDDYILALASGLAIEFTEKSIKKIENINIEIGAVLID